MYTIGSTTDFRERLVETARVGDVRSFAPLHAGQYQLSIQASARHRSVPTAAVPPHQVGIWEVAIFSRDGHEMRKHDLQPVASDPWFMDAWTGGTLFLPSESIDQLMNILQIGIEVYYELDGVPDFLLTDSETNPPR